MCSHQWDVAGAPIHPTVSIHHVTLLLKNLQGLPSARMMASKCLSPASASSQSAITDQLQPHPSSSSITLSPLYQPAEHQLVHASGSLPMLYPPPLDKLLHFLQYPIQMPISPPIFSSNPRKFWSLLLLCFQNIGCKYAFQHLPCYYIYLHMFIFPTDLWALWRQGPCPINILIIEPGTQ